MWFDGAADELPAEVSGFEALDDEAVREKLRLIQ